MKLCDLKPADGAKKAKKRVGRGNGSGHGKTSCRGSKGQKARSGGKVNPGFEGGQMPLTRRLPKRGFTNPFRRDMVAVNVSALNVFEKGALVDTETLLERRIIKRRGDGVKVLGKGDISVPLTVKVQGVSRAAREKIEASGGTVEVE